MAAKRKPEPRRVRLTVPAVDESVLAWLDLQDNASASMRMLVRESIARDGYIDVINKPVEQLPRRGRPPQGEADEQSNTPPPEAQAMEEQVHRTPAQRAASPARIAEPEAFDDGTEAPLPDVEAQIEEGALAPRTSQTKGIPEGLEAFLTM
ncbi:hypothetical protein [Psychromicrobium sp. YIM B11713]|uniref:hypothetical protein n=1 Tax=Psychromicrobium sp. YIM B11713 TaxID=3145233 RepID=UPI00374EFE40